MSYRLEDLDATGYIKTFLLDYLSEAAIGALEATIQPYVAIELEPVEHGDLLWWQSRLGGKPYLPQGMAYPTIRQKPAVFLAQINLAEVPLDDLLELSSLPRAGILQFYVEDSQSWGGNFDPGLTQDGYCILYFAEVDRCPENRMTDFSSIKTQMPDLIGTCHRLSFHQKLAPIALDDIHFPDRMVDPSLYEEALEQLKREAESNDDSVLTAIFNLLKGNEHRLGGYPCFYLDDPRSNVAEPEEQYIQLLQIKPELLSDDRDTPAYWVAEIHFFMQRAAMRQFDTSKIAYHVQFNEY